MGKRMNTKTDKKLPKYTMMKDEPSEIAKFRKLWLRKGYELIDITQHIEFKLGQSGWCNDFNEPNENIYHIQAWYRDDVIANFPAVEPIDDDKHVIYYDEDEGDFIIFRKVKVEIKGD